MKLQINQNTVIQLTDSKPINIILRGNDAELFRSAKNKISVGLFGNDKKLNNVDFVLWLLNHKMMQVDVHV